MRIHLLTRSQWILVGLAMLFVLIYFGLLSWGNVQDALEALAAKPSGAKVFAAKVDRADAIFMVFMFLFLTPLALAAVIGLIAFLGAMLGGFLESFWKTPGMPDWLFTGIVYLLLLLVAYFTRGLWAPHTQGFFSLIARALISASR
jgi:hypothetical protein